MRWGDTFRRRLILMVAASSLLLAIAGAIAASLVARHFYFRHKLAAAEPVATWVYAKENAAILQKDADQAHTKKRMVLIGDSRVRPMRVSGLDSKWEVLNRGINGETSAQMRLRFANDILALKPDVVIIQSGINDLVAGIGSKAKAPAITSRTIENLKWVSEASAAAGARVVLLTVIPPSTPDLARRFVWSESVRQEVAKVNENLLAWKPPPGVQLLDLGKMFGATTTLPDHFAVDTLHLNQKSYQLIDERLGEIISAIDE